MDGTVLAATGDGVAVELTIVLAVAVGSLWLAARLQVPAVILLLGAGVLVGPVADLVDPSALLGDLLFPLVSAGVAVLLFEGGFQLRWSRLEVGRGPVLRLVTVGVGITWLAGAAATSVFFDTSVGISLLIGAILVVSGPTVVLPLLRQARLREPVNGILKWEGILIDAVGAILAITVLEALVGESDGPALAIFLSLLTGLVIGSVVAALVIVALRNHWVPDDLQVPLVLAAVILANTAASELRPEAGLVAATLLGVVLANQRWAAMGHVAEFNEHLGQIVLGLLFIVLGASIDLGELGEVVVPGLGLVAVLLVTRVLVAFVATARTDTTVRERAYLGVMAPRGIVAAAVATLFAIELEEVGRDPYPIVPLVFFVIVTTVVIYGVAARPMAKLLQVAKAPPRGVAFVGGPTWVLDVAATLTERGVPTLLITSDGDEGDAARERGLLVYNGTLDASDLPDTLDTVGVREAIVGSNNHELNELAVERLSGQLGRSHVYLLPRTDDHEEAPAGADAASFGRRPFAARATQHALESAVDGDAEVFVRSAVDGESVELADDEIALFTLRGETDPPYLHRPGGPALDDGVEAVVVLGPVTAATALLEEPAD